MAEKLGPIATFSWHPDSLVNPVEDAGNKSLTTCPSAVDLSISSELGEAGYDR